MQVKLKILKGSNVGKEVRINGPKCVIGRSEECQIRPQSDAVSRRHTQIHISEKEVVVRDLKSRNGTFVNEQRIVDDAVLLSGDILRIGPLEFEVIIEQTILKQKRPPVQGIQDLVARTAGVSASSSTMELGDVSKWIEEADEVAKAHRMADPDTRQFRLDETDLGPQAGAEDKTADMTTKEGRKTDPGGAAKDAKAEEPKKEDTKAPDKKAPGKLPPAQAASTKNSRDAAADTLKRFFGKR